MVEIERINLRLEMNGAGKERNSIGPRAERTRGSYSAGLEGAANHNSTFQTTFLNGHAISRDQTRGIVLCGYGKVSPRLSEKDCWIVHRKMRIIDIFSSL